MLLLMNKEEFKNIRTYLTARRLRGKKWTQEATALELVRDRQSVIRYESGQSEIPELVAEKMKELLREAATEDLSDSLAGILVNVHTPADVSKMVEKIKQSL